jgi:hypothetical protein
MLRASGCGRQQAPFGLSTSPEPSATDCIIRAMPMNEAEVLAECHHALADTELAPEQVRVFRLSELGTGHVGAAWFRPHTDISQATGCFQAAMKSAGKPTAPRTGGCTASRFRPSRRTRRCSPPSFGMSLSTRASRTPSRASSISRISLRTTSSPQIAGGLDGCGGWLINTIPSEMDCNAAASVYIAQRFSAAEIQPIRDGPQKYLACSLIPPLPPETLPEGMIAFASVHRAAVERHAARRGFPVASILRSVYPPAPDLWARLEERPWQCFGDVPELGCRGQPATRSVESRPRLVATS